MKEEGLTDFAASESVTCDHLAFCAQAEHQEIGIQGGGTAYVMVGRRQRWKGTGDPQGYIPSDLLALSRSQTFTLSEPPDIAPWLGMKCSAWKPAGDLPYPNHSPNSQLSPPPYSPRPPHPCLRAMGLTGMVEASRTVQRERACLSNYNKSGEGRLKREKQNA